MARETTSLSGVRALLRVGPGLLLVGSVLVTTTAAREWVRAPGPAALVRDIATELRSPLSSILAWKQVGTSTYFALRGPRGGELWKTDGTAAGTVPILSLSRELFFVEMTELGGKLVFSFPDESVGREVWMSDGTPEGTSLLKDILPGPGGLVTGFERFGGQLFFQADDGVHGAELWMTDGTPDGTVIVSDFVPGRAGSHPYDLVVLRDTLYFLIAEGRQHALVRSDGTASGTSLVVRLSAFYPPLCRLGCRALAPVGLMEWSGKLAFTGMDTVAGVEPWVSDGTAEGTRRIEDISPGSNSSFPVAFVELGGTLFFSAEGLSLGRELWQTDGTPEGTHLVRDIRPGSASANVGLLTVAGDSIFFVAFTDSEGAELWRSDGTEAGTWLVDDVQPGPGSSLIVEMAAIGDDLFFVATHPAHGQRLWRSDGTGPGTGLVAFPAPRERAVSRGLMVGDGQLFFPASSPRGTSLWSVHGSRAEASEIEPLERPGSNPLPQIGAGGSLFFLADDSPPSVYQLWRVAAATGDAVRLTGYPQSAFPFAGGALDGLLLFSASDFLYGSELWSSDGTPQGTRLLRDLAFSSDSSAPGNFRRIGSQLFFTALLSGGRSVLMRSDGTAEGTIEVMSLSPIPFGVPFPELVVLRGILYFKADDGVHGLELWRSDGTAAGTHIVRDIASGSLAADPRNLTVAGDRLFFKASSPETGAELWVSDGTGVGTALVEDLRPGVWSGEPRQLTAAGELLFFVATGESFFNELWRSDGTSEGTFRLRESRETGMTLPTIANLTAVGPRLFFADYTVAHGIEPWTSRGTEADTRLVADLLPGPVGSFPNALADAGGTLLFSANGGVSGWELWRSDGTPIGTYRVQDIHTGPQSSNPAGFVRLGSHVFFAAEDAEAGRELWSMPLDALVPSRIPRPEARPVAFRP